MPVESQKLYLNGAALVDNSKSLESVGIKNGEMLAVIVQHQRGPQPQQQTGQAQGSQSSRIPSAEQCETQRLQLLGNSNYVAQIQREKPELAAVLHDPVRFREVWTSMYRDEERRRREIQEQNALLEADPFNVEAQRKIEDSIRQERIMENFHNALEHNPEG